MTRDDLLDRASITDHVLRYATGIDRRDWPLYRSIFADQITITCYMAAHHHLVTGDLREMHSIGGYYVHHLRRDADGWLIHATQLNVTWEMGDRSLFEQVALRRA